MYTHAVESADAEKRPSRAPTALPLSSVQQAIWFDQILAPELPHYNIGCLSRIDGPVHIEALAQALRQVVEQHDVLRTVLRSKGAIPEQEVLRQVELPLTIVDFSHEPDAENLAEDYVRQAFGKRFPLTDHLLWDARIVQVGPARFYWLHFFHHLIMDGYGTALAFQSVRSEYSRIVAGEAGAAQTGPSYVDFVVEDQAYLASARHERDLSFWRQRFPTLPAPLLPCGVLEGAPEVRGRDAVEWPLERSLFERIAEFSARHGCSTAHFMFGLVYAYFARTTDVEEAVIGVPVHNRSGAAQRQTLGTFSSVIPVGIRVDRQAGFVALMHAVAEELRRCYRHQRCPVAEIKRQLGLGQDRRSRLFDVSVSFEPVEGGGQFGPARQYCSGLQFSRTPLEIVVRDTHQMGDVRVEFHHDERGLPRAEVERMRERMSLMAQAVLDGATAALKDLPFMTAEERQLVLHGFNATAHPYPDDSLIHELFEAQVRHRPTATAAVFEGERLSYAELNARANQLARHLRTFGVGPDTLVALCVERSLEMVVGVLGILKAGGAYVPLDPAYPSERLQFMLDDAAPRVLVTQQRLRGGLRTQAPVVALDADWPAIFDQDDADLEPAAIGLQPHHLAYVIYTSGSTGKPKGVMVEHRGVCNLAAMQIREFDFGPHRRVLQFSSLSFDTSVWEYTMAWANGASLHLASRERLLPGQALLDTLRTEQITHVILPPAAAAALPRGGVLDSLVALVVGGDVCPAVLPQQWGQQRRFFNAYGPTETTVCATTYLCDPQDPRMPPIGRPIANTRIYILDEQRRPVPVGVTGELYIGGVGVARGYLGRPELTAERFIADPFSSHAQARMYRTGDLGRWRSDGNIEYLGRNDHQVKIRGFRIELGEIETQLNTQPQVKDAVVIAREDTPGDKRLVAYVIAQEPGAVLVDALRAHLKAVLPEYMVPSAFVVLDNPPLTPSGKVDRQALPAPDWNSLQTQQFEAPRGAAEQALAAIWQEVLQIERVGRHDSFFALGGHSLLAVQLIERLRQAGWQAEVATVFNHPVLVDLAARLARDGATVARVAPCLIEAGCEHITPELLTLVALEQSEIDTIVASVPGGARNVQDIYPLAPLQEGIWFHHMLNGHQDVYVLPALLSFDSRERLDAFARALQSVIDRHDVMRTAVVWRGLSQPVQVVWRQADVSVQTLQLQAGEDAQQVLQGRLERGELYLDLQQAPLVRLEAAADPARGRWLVLLQLHHIVNDHVSLDIVLEEVAAHLQGRAERLPEPVAYRSFVAQALLQAQQHDAEEFFRAKLGDVQEPTAPFGLLDVRGGGQRLEEARREVEAELGQRLRGLAQGLGVSAATLFHVAWAMVVAHCSGRDDVVFGTVLLGRLQGGVAGADRALGMFINTLPLRLRLKEVTVHEAVQQAQRELVELLAHEQASLALAQRCSGASPLFTAMLNYRHSREQSHARLGPGVEVLVAQERSNYPFSLMVDDLGDGFVLNAQVDCSVGAARVTAYIHTALEGLAHALAAQPQAGLLTLPILPLEERRQVLQHFNATRCDFPEERLVHQWFEAQAAQTPDAVAVRDDVCQLSYRELNARANQLARYLRAHGVGPDRRVAICTERSAGLIVALLGVLKAGGAYVPLDPGYPAERINDMLEDAEPTVILTEARLQAALAGKAAHVVALDAQWPEILLHREADLEQHEVGLLPRHLAYVIYTSGSTGRPKGVMIEHAAWLNYLQWAVRAYECHAGEGAVVSSSIAFDATITSLYTPLLCGRTVVLVRDGDELAGLEALLRQGKAWSLIKITPAHLDALGRRLQANPAPCAVRAFVIGGEALAPATVALWRGICPQARLINEYGPTETVVGCSVYELPADTSDLVTVPIGRPIANTQIYLLDERRQPVPIGVPGEIYIGGAGVARGYLNRPELTAERFVPDPFSEVPNAKLYKTGDLGRWRADGHLEYLGRNDHQVKIRGFRVELGEIEAQLARHEQVKEAVVIAREDVPGHKRLVAYVTVQGEAAPGVAQLRSTLKAVLPEYMVPAAIVMLPCLPLTPNGKVDRQALPAPDLSALQARQYEAPVGRVEAVLAAIWQDILQVGQVGRHDNFFELGGHSLLAVQLIERLRQAGWKAEVASIFMRPTLAELAAGLTPLVSVPCVAPCLIEAGCEHITPELLTLVALEQSEIDTVVASVLGGARNVQDIYPLAPLQEGIWFHHMLNEQQDVYVLPALLSFDSRERLDAFARALQSVIDRHDVMRTAVVWRGLSQPVQVVWRQADVSVQTLQLQAGEDAQQVLQGRLERGELYLDLQQAPLVRLEAAADPARGRWLVLLQLHHIVNDHVSLDIVLEEVAAHLQGRAERLPEPVAYRSFVAQALLQAQQHDAEEFFRAKLGDVQEPTAPFGLLDVRGGGQRLEETRREVHAELGQRLRGLAQGLGVSAATLFHVAWAMVVAHCSGRDDVVFGTVLLGRLQGGVAGADRALGMFINTLPLRLRLQEVTVHEAVQQAQRELVELLAHEQASLALAQRCSGAAPLFTAMLNYRHSANAAGPMPATGIELLATQERTNYPLSLMVDDLGERFELGVQVDRSVDAERVAGYMHTALESLARALEAQPQARLLALPILPGDELQQVLQGFNGNDSTGPDERLVHQLFEAQARRCPDAAAVVYGGDRLSYADLNARANRLARELRAQGVGPDTPVAVCMERSLEMVVALLGILKAGGAYVPLDPAYPTERLEYMLADAAPTVVITQARLRGRVATAARVLALEAGGPPVEAQEAGDVEAASIGLAPHHLAYVIYTSGSTGTPKGVAMPHSALVNLLKWQRAALRSGKPQRTLQFAALGFDVAFQETFTTLATGGTLVMIPEAVRGDPVALVRLLHEQAVQRVFLPFVALHHLAEAMVASSQALPCLEDVITAGEQLRITPAIAALFKSQPGCRLHNHYGPTESHVVTALSLPEEVERWPELPTIGTPIANARLYILDERRQPVPIGVTGEIYIGGVAVARGYLNRPELTAERFVADPFSAEPQAQMYRTGDLGRWRADGQIDYLGRNDDQVKVRGFRIELGEIEAQLARHAQVKDAVVVAREEVPGEKRLVAYLTVHEPGLVTMEGLREHLSTALPEHMVPAVFVVLERLPLTPNGKVDRRALPPPDAGLLQARQYQAPQGEHETTMVSIWQELLGFERVGRHDNFFDLGGHSLVATRLVTRIREVFAVELALLDVFNHATVAALTARVIDAQLSQFDASDIARVLAALDDLSEAQLQEMAGSTA
ncbi:non-ribosomal peptide synthetase [Caldimonas brevitalea]|uniref:Non-ribosomal peptide synthetase module n=1 Tax=Caldimonas brevitalea TaxID=413882 RepID=A0A0G3BQ01_9BURK|nr:non-ribosomal peptide synthetase [Caldimonas brevitalea]AKJ30063.1 non-ribosomal peptide synthetase module [Caldimonas brevitalea]